MKTYHGIIVPQHSIDPTNGIAERQVRRTKEGTSAVLLQSGLDEKWEEGRADSVESCCHLQNVQDLLADGKNTSGNHLLAGSYGLVQCLKISRFRQKTSQGSANLVKKCQEHSSDVHWLRREFGKGDVSGLDSLDASEIHARRPKAKEVLTSVKGENFIFPRMEQQNCAEEITKSENPTFSQTL